MPHETLGLHHLHVRKRLTAGLEPYPSPDRWKNLLDKLVYVVGIGGPVMTIPQLVQIWWRHEARGVSVVSWASYLATAFVWLLYGLVHKEKPIVLTYSLWIVLDTLIVIGVLRYG
jgi:uncharacterized protein with PQ loop repeat